MDTKKVLMATLAGGVTFFLLGYLVWGVIFAKFFEANMGSATGVMKDPPAFLGIILSSLVMAFLLAYIFNRWANISTLQTGALAGALIVGLMGASTDLMMYSTANLSNLTATIVDIILMVVIGAILGGVIGLVLGSGKKA